jgi:hypothetical protein
MVNEQETDE